jgi:hypothetical protein
MSIIERVRGLGDRCLVKNSVYPPRLMPFVIKAAIKRSSPPFHMLYGLQSKGGEQQTGNWQHPNNWRGESKRVHSKFTLNYISSERNSQFAE